jgi:hypothetical protein
MLEATIPLKFTSEKRTITFQDFATTTNAEQFLLFYEVARKIHTQQPKQGVCVSCIMDLAQQHDIYIDYVVLPEKKVIFTLSSKRRIFPAVFLFGMQFEEVEV